MKNLKILHNKQVEEYRNKLPVDICTRVDTIISEMNKMINRKSIRNMKGDQ